MAMKNTNMGKAQATKPAKPVPAKKPDKAPPKKMPAMPMGGNAGLPTPPMGTPAGVGGSDEVV